ncbi:hypothetical protein SSX86_025901 [Deinandra increscens subsp. villosa]|uniref:Hexosyltransferase n=1 Tax=Deinandra increscens subsp. villosa TaxID=3103831 RepID=A0AAP0GNH1_9ASTR
MASSKPFPSKQKPFTLLLLLLCLTLTLLIQYNTTYNLHLDDDPPATLLPYAATGPPRWYDKLQYMIQNHSNNKLKIGLVNLDVDQIQVNGLADVTTINFKSVINNDGGENKKWEDFFPEWVDEDGKWGTMKCPEIPLPESYEKVDVVVARVPGGGQRRDLFRLQVNLVVANVLVNSGWGVDGDHEEVYVVFIGDLSGGPMWEIFRCDDMIWEEKDYRIYKPDLGKLKQKVNMPVGSCMISPSHQFDDADLIVLKNLDELFGYPQLSAVGNNKYLFNSGLIIIEPSKCMFNSLMKNIFTFGSYNGGDQGFLNEAFTWWHRLHSRVNRLKVFLDQKRNYRREIRDDLYTLHFLGLKPWVCYKDYDCNWDKPDCRHFASDSAHRKWWEVYEAMPGKLKGFCGLTKKLDARIQKWRGVARKGGFRDGHWKMKVKDRRRATLDMMV